MACFAFEKREKFVEKKQKAKIAHVKRGEREREGIALDLDPGAGGPQSRGHDEPRSMAVSGKSTSKSFFFCCWHG